MKKISIAIALMCLALTVGVACSNGETPMGSGGTSVESSGDSVDTGSDSSNDSTSDDNTSGGSDSSGGNDSSDDSIKENCLVTFDSDGGTAVQAVTVKKGGRVEKPADPIKIDVTCEYVFEDWYYGNEKWDFATAVTEDITLVAHWKVGSKYTEPFLPKD